MLTPRPARPVHLGRVKPDMVVVLAARPVQPPAFTTAQLRISATSNAVQGPSFAIAGPALGERPLQILRTRGRRTEGDRSYVGPSRARP